MRRHVRYFPIRSLRFDEDQGNVGIQDMEKTRFMILEAANEGELIRNMTRGLGVFW